MKLKTFFLCNLSIAVLSLVACGGSGKTASLQTGGDTIEIKYARNLCVVSYDGYKVATLRNPWDTLKVLHTYILAERDASLPDDLPDGTVVRVPLRKAMVYSSVHCSLAGRLGALESIGGVCDLKYIKMPEIQKRVGTGRVVDAGSGMNPDIEKIINLNPDGILLSSFENNGGYGRIEKLGVPIIECADYMETSALGRAEWMKFYGLLFGRYEEALAEFSAVEEEYLSLKAEAARLEGRPRMFGDLKNGAVWYVPGGNSTMGRIYADAGADYVFAYLENSGSVPMNFEAVFDKAQDADVWLIKYNAPRDKTYGELASEYAPYARFKAFGEKHIYGCNTGTVSYYEEIPFHPEWLLRELIKIFHPEALEGYELKYFRKLAE